MLTSWGVEFDPVDVNQDPRAYDALKRLGVPRVPAVTVGDRAVHGWNPAGYAALLGVHYEAAARFTPAELAERLEIVLATTERLLLALSLAQAEYRPPERDRTVKQLGYHVFRVAASFPDAMDLGQLPESWFEEQAPAHMADAPAVAAYGARVRERLARWCAGRPEEDYARVIDVYYGPQGAHDLFERTTWHAAQHLRQLYALADRLGVTPPVPLPADALRGLPLPESLW